MISLIGEQGIIITRKTTAATSSLRRAHFNVMELEKQLLLATRSIKNDTPPLHGKVVMVVVSIETLIVRLFDSPTMVTVVK
jgi:hypothetical protein